MTRYIVNGKDSFLGKLPLFFKVFWTVFYIQSKKLSAKTLSIHIFMLFFALSF